uniref:Uncharacterized protein n=1 Tax=Anguilla anguilla TaxID=7936 RepID=A0A0E9TAL0_ANGAN
MAISLRCVESVSQKKEKKRKVPQSRGEFRRIELVVTEKP